MRISIQHWRMAKTVAFEGDGVICFSHSRASLFMFLVYEHWNTLYFKRPIESVCRATRYLFDILVELNRFASLWNSGLGVNIGNMVVQLPSASKFLPESTAIDISFICCCQPLLEIFKNHFYN